ncbi:MAG: bifunctional oligoribonuclease/PAP phosphatase NrnA, partial [Halobacteriaceae archaeon]
MALNIPSDPISTGVGLAAIAIVIGAAGGYAISALRGRRQDSEEEEDVAELKQTITGFGEIALVTPENPSIDALAASIGLQALCTEWGISADIYTNGEVTAEDANAFCNIFDLDPTPVEQMSDVEGCIAVGGGGPVPTFGKTPVIAVVRHRPATTDHETVIARSDYGSTSTTVTQLLKEAGVVPEQHVATALLYGIRAGTNEFRRVRSQADYQAASYLHDYADQGRIEALRSPGMSGETFDVIGKAIKNRERRESFAVTNVGDIPTVGALDEAADTLLRLDGVSSAAVFGTH